MHRFKITIAILIISLFSFFSWNCTKIDTTTIGSGLIPAVDNVHTFDTSLSVIAINYDSVNTFCDTLYRHSDHALGYISNDPHFGKSTSAIFMELKPSFFPFSYPAVRDSLFGDSVVLVLQHTKTFGDSTVPQKVNVFLLNQAPFKPDTSYTSCYSFAYDNSNILGSAVYSPAHFKDTTKSYGDTSINELRIRLTGETIAGLFIQDSTKAFKIDSPNYKLFFPGLAIVPDVSYGGNAFSYFNLDSNNTKLAIYYHYILNGVKDTAVTNFRFTGLSGEANQILRDRTGADISSHLTHNPLGDDQVYIQTSPGSFANLRIPNLTGLSNRIIHRADLVMESIPNTLGDPFQAPDFLYLQTRDSSQGNKYHSIPCDFFVSSNVANISSFGGFKTLTTDNLGNTVNKYSFNITRYIQNFITRGRPDMDLRLSAPTHVFSNVGFTDYCGQTLLPFNYPLNANAYGRVILGGGNNATYRMKLNIVYSTL